MPDPTPRGEAERPVPSWLAQPVVMAIWCVVAAFGTYACMYGFRKPFTAGGYVDPATGMSYKVWLVTAQVLGYTLSKFIGIRVIAEMRPERRIWVLLGLIGAAQLALVAFGLTPQPYYALCLFLNGLPLGMVFGLVLGFLEGRRLTEAFIAGLCASFILADGVTKSVGAELLRRGVPEPWMPAAAGLVFLLPLLGFVWMLQHVPAPSAADVAARAERSPMQRAERRAFLERHGMGLALLGLAYLLITVLRSLRADFAPEIWSGLGVAAAPELFTRSELVVTLGVVVATGLGVLVRDNRRAFFIALGTSLGGLLLMAFTLAARETGRCGPFAFMVLMGLGMYIPYVSVHTTVFERLIAMTRDRGNIGYLMYLVDAVGYLGYVAVMIAKNFSVIEGDQLRFFVMASWAGALLSIFAVAGAWWFFARHEAVRLPAGAPAVAGP